MVGRALNARRDSLKHGDVARWEKTVAKTLGREPRTLQLYRQIARGLDDAEIATALRLSDLDTGQQALLRKISAVRAGRDPDATPEAPSPTEWEARLRRRISRFIGDIEGVPDPVALLKWAAAELEAAVGDFQIEIEGWKGNNLLLLRGDSLVRVQGFPDNHLAAIVTDPPYGIGFDKTWDSPGLGEGTDAQRYQRWCEAWLTEALRALKPGGVCKVFAATRTQHRVAAAMEEVGFGPLMLEAWVYGSGLPKGLDVAKALDRLSGTPGEVVGQQTRRHAPTGIVRRGADAGQVRTTDIRRPGSPDAVRFEGFNTQLKPAWEAIVVGRKPLAGPVASPG